MQEGSVEDDGEDETHGVCAEEQTGEDGSGLDWGVLDGRGRGTTVDTTHGDTGDPSNTKELSVGLGPWGTELADEEKSETSDVGPFSGVIIGP